MPRVRLPKSKHWVFTINNPTDADALTPNQLGQISYLIIGKEVGDEGTPHWQGYVVFINRKRRTGVARFFPRGRLAIKEGTVLEALTYCKKDGDYQEWGTVPVTAQEAVRNNWDDMYAHAKRGEFEEIPKNMLIRYYHAFKRIQQDHPVKPPSLLEKDNEWVLAPSGYGKSTYVRRKYEDIYDKAPNKWFVGYQNEETILCDDFGPEQCKYLGWYLKRWADNFSFPMETKGGGRMIRPKHIVVTSQYAIEDCFEDMETVEAINNRFETTNLTHWLTRVEPDEVPANPTLLLEEEELYNNQ